MEIVVGFELLIPWGAEKGSGVFIWARGGAEDPAQARLSAQQTGESH